VRGKRRRILQVMDRKYKTKSAIPAIVRSATLIVAEEGSAPPAPPRTLRQAAVVACRSSSHNVERSLKCMNTHRMTERHVWVGPILLTWCACAPAWADSGPDLAQLVQNPIAKVISLPFQNNLNFGVGPDHDPQNLLNIQPVLPFQLGRDWNLITRTIIPVDYQPPALSGGSDFGGIGDISLALYFSPARPTHGVIWGVGPALVFPSANHQTLGQGKFSTGISAVALTVQGHWLMGTLVTEVASVSGVSYRRNVNQMLVQPFINYNFPRGWYLTSSPIVTANWRAPRGQQWMVPVGGGGGRAFRVGKQALNAQIQAFDDVTHPRGSGNWTLRAQFQLLFPK